MSTCVSNNPFTGQTIFHPFHCCTFTDITDIGNKKIVFFFYRMFNFVPKVFSLKTAAAVSAFSAAFMVASFSSLLCAAFLMKVFLARSTLVST